MDYISSKIICPFYKRESTRNSFICDGFFKGHSISEQFINQKMKKDFQETFCMSFNYELCPIAKALLVEDTKKNN